MSTIYIPESAATIGSSVLFRWYKLTTIYDGGTEEEWAARAANISAPETATIHYNYEYN